MGAEMKLMFLLCVGYDSGHQIGNLSREMEKTTPFINRESEMEHVKQVIMSKIPCFSTRREPFRWIKAADHFECRRHHNIPQLPSTSWCANPTMEHLCWRFGTWFSNPELLKLAIGPLIKDILFNFRQVIEKDVSRETNTPRILAYSGHDVTLLPLLHALMRRTRPAPHAGMLGWPEYSTVMAMELVEKFGPFRGGSSWTVRVVQIAPPVMPYGYLELLRQRSSHGDWTPESVLDFVLELREFSESANCGNLRVSWYQETEFSSWEQELVDMRLMTEGEDFGEVEERFFSGSASFSRFRSQSRLQSTESNGTEESKSSNTYDSIKIDNDSLESRQETDSRDVGQVGVST